MEEKITGYLKQNRLSVTDSRKKILELLVSADAALSHQDIDRGLEGKFDRVTVYRTLQTFLDKGIIHTIPTPDGSTRYALCKDCEEGHHHDDHVHFVCDQCGTTTCLDEVHIPTVQLPAGYKAGQVEMVVNGICNQCSE